MAATTHYKAKIAMGDMTSFKDFMDESDPKQMMRNALFINSGTPRSRPATPSRKGQDGNFGNDGFQSTNYNK